MDSLAISLQGDCDHDCDHGGHLTSKWHLDWDYDDHVIRLVVMLLMKTCISKYKLIQARSRPNRSPGICPLDARLLPHIPCHPQHGEPQ